jgi:hypothetical protein
MQQQLTTLNVSRQSKELLARSSLTALDLMCDPTQAHRLQDGRVPTAFVSLKRARKADKRSAPPVSPRSCMWSRKASLQNVLRSISA